MVGASSIPVQQLRSLWPSTTMLFEEGVFDTVLKVSHRAIDDLEL